MIKNIRNLNKKCLHFDLFYDILFKHYSVAAPQRGKCYAFRHLSGWSSFINCYEHLINFKGGKLNGRTSERIQMFEGTVIAMKGSGVSKTFTVRRLSYGVGVERVFPLHSANVDSVKVIRKGKVRRAKLYYLRDRVGKAAKVKEDI